MKQLYRLTLNEIEKMLYKKRIWVIVCILTILVPIFVYAQYSEYQNTIEKFGTSDWKIALQSEITNTQSRLNNSHMPQEWASYLKVQLKQSQYYLDNNINPTEPGAPSFSRIFLERSLNLFIPLLVLIVSIDIVSGERSDGTIKVLLTRPIPRWKVLLSKWIGMQIFVGIIILSLFLISFVISGLFFSFNGLFAPVITGFQMKEGKLIIDNIRILEQWKYLFMIYGLGWFVGATVASIAFMISVLVRSTAAAMGIMLASLIAGGILTGFATSWSLVKYLYSVNLQLTDYLVGQAPIIKGLSLQFSVLILLIWGSLSTFIAFFTFTKQDIL